MELMYKSPVYKIFFESKHLALHEKILTMKNYLQGTKNECPI